MCLWDECGGQGQKLTIADLYPPRDDEASSLPPHLSDLYSAFQALDRGEDARVQVWTSGTAYLDECGVKSRRERLWALGLWCVIRDELESLRAQAIEQRASGQE